MNTVCITGCFDFTLQVRRWFFFFSEYSALKFNPNIIYFKMKWDKWHVGVIETEVLLLLLFVWWE